MALKLNPSSAPVEEAKVASATPVLPSRPWSAVSSGLLSLAENPPSFLLKLYVSSSAAIGATQVQLPLETSPEKSLQDVLNAFEVSDDGLCFRADIAAPVMGLYAGRHCYSVVGRVPLRVFDVEEADTWLPHTSLRFLGVFHHSQNDALQQVSPIVLRPFLHSLMCEEKKDGVSDPVRMLGGLLQAAHVMLEKPLPEQIPPQTSDMQLYHDYMHSTENVCVHKTAVNPAHARAVAQQIRASFPTLLKHKFEGTAQYMATGIGIEQQYKALHPCLFDKTRLSAEKDADLYSGCLQFPTEWLHPDLVRMLDQLSSSQQDVKASLLKFLRAEADRVYSFPCLSEHFCDLLVEELAHFEKSGLPQLRPNSMNNYGLIINFIGLHHLMSALMDSVIRPLSALLYADSGGETLNQHHSFVVQYRPDADVSLDMHTDDSDVTLNVALAKEFSGGSLTFCGASGDKAHRVLQKEYAHVRGRAVIHRGIHRHGANEITGGERNNLIVWCRSTALRLSPAFAERYHRDVDAELAPDPLCLSRTHDRDYAAYKKVFDAA